jgi:hypothetical protein
VGFLIAAVFFFVVHSSWQIIYEDKWTLIVMWVSMILWGDPIALFRVLFGRNPANPEKGKK